MKRTMINHIRRAAAFLLSLLLCAQTVPLAFAADGRTIYIDTAEDLLALAEHCSLDTWSQGKTVVLRADISLGSTDYSPIPTFGGTFDGGGRAITGLDLTGSRSTAGLFGILQEGAVVRDLKVSGSVRPSDDSENVGGIAGRNGGLIENCTFSGSVSGGDGVGGIAGTNSLTGRVRGCTAVGNVSGRSRTGGIAGNNLGVVSACRNDSYVNITSVDPGINLSTLDLDPTLRLFTLTSLDTINVATDTGGIAGYSSGMVLGCVNNGVVGYQHVGYNVGGIAGRSCGHMAHCVNNGQVLGRKDIGGIVGQAEPYVVLNLSENTLQTIRSQLDALQRLVNQTADHADGSSADISGQLSTISGILDTAAGHAESLTDQLSDYGDDVITEINRGSDILTDALDQLDGISGKAADLSVQITNGIDALERAVRELARAEGFSSAAIQDLLAAADHLKTANSFLTSGTKKITGGIKLLLRSVEIQDGEAAGQALDQIGQGLDDLAQATALAASAVEALADALSQVPRDYDTVTSALTQLSEAITSTGRALDRISGGITVLRDNISFDLEDIRTGLDQIEAGMDDLVNALEAVSKASGHLKNALSKLETASGHLKTATEVLADALDTLGGASEDGQDIFSDMEDLLDFLSGADSIQIAHPSDGISASSDALYDSLELLNNHMELLNGAVTATSHTLTNDVRAISDLFRRMMDTVLDAVDDAEKDREDRFSDTSQADIDAVTSGKILSCSNTATISGDINTGGVAGSMAVEYELDPESETFSSDAPLYRREYELKAILQGCSNTGAVTGRRNYVSAICGRMDLGLITGCQGCGSAESENGNYVGGIAGFTTGAIRDSYAKCRLSGEKYIGGIVGSAALEGATNSVGEVSCCVSLVSITEAKQYSGAIAGIHRGDFRGNRFVSDTLAGIDRVSITGEAEPVSYETLLETPDLPDSFRRFTLRFLAGDRVLKTVYFHYGDSFDGSVFPNIPQEEGSFAVWDRTELTDLHFDTDVTAEYAPYLSAIPSDQQRSDGRPVFLVEGQFSSQDQLAAQIGGEEADLSGAVRGTPASTRSLVELWRLSVPSDGLDAHTVRYLSSSGKPDHLEVYAQRGGRWEKLAVEAVGSYLKFDMPANAGTLAVVFRTTIWWIWLLCVGAAAVLTAVLLLYRRLSRRKKRAVPLPEEGVRSVPAPKPVGKRRWVWPAAGVLLLLALGTAWFFGSGMNDRAAACHLLRKYAQKPQLSMELSASAKVGSRTFTTCTSLSRMEVDGRRVTCAEQYGVPLYYSGGLVYLENGKTFDTGPLFPDYSALLDNAEALYRLADVSVYANRGETIYSIIVKADDAQALLARLLPAAAARLSAAQDVDIDLVASGGELSEIRFSADVTLDNAEEMPAAISLRLSIHQSGQVPEIPQAVRYRLLSGPALEEQAAPAGDLLRLLTAWLKLNAEDPFTAQLSLSANCGPLVLDDALELSRTRVDGMQVDRIRKNGHSLYFTDQAACGEEGESLTGDEESVTLSADLVKIAYQLCMSSDLVRLEQGGAEVYTLSLDGEGLESVAYAILPQARELNISLTGGSIQVTLSDDAIRRIRFTCDGTVRVLFTEAPMSLSAELTPQASDGPVILSDGVLDALKKGK